MYRWMTNEVITHVSQFVCHQPPEQPMLLDTDPPSLYWREDIPSFGGFDDDDVECRF